VIAFNWPAAVKYRLPEQ